MELIDGKALAEKIKDRIAGEVRALGDDRPNLAIILVGEREDSKIYVSLKEKQAKTVGIDTHLYRCDEDIAESELLSVIDYLNQDELIDGILLQLPLPDGLDADKVVARIDPAKDVDGFHPDSLKALLSGCGCELEPPLLGVVKAILESVGCELQGKQVAALVNSDIFGRALEHVLACAGAGVSVFHGDEADLAERTRQADVLIVALGRPGFVTAAMVKDGAVVIDIGITRLSDGTVAGDVDAASLKGLSGHLTPVPGGVGPLTIAMAFKNTLKLYQAKREKGKGKN